MRKFFGEPMRKGWLEFVCSARAVRSCICCWGAASHMADSLAHTVGGANGGATHTHTSHLPHSSHSPYISGMCDSDSYTKFLKLFAENPCWQHFAYIHAMMMNGKAESTYGLAQFLPSPHAAMCIVQSTNRIYSFASVHFSVGGSWVSVWHGDTSELCGVQMHFFFKFVFLHIFCMFWSRREIRLANWVTIMNVGLNGIPGGFLFHMNMNEYERLSECSVQTWIYVWK